MTTVKMGSRGQITIPKEIRRYLGLREGDMIALIPQAGQAILQPMNTTLLELRGSVPVPGAQDFDAIRQQVTAERAKKVAADER